MTLPATGPISLSDVNVELGKAANAAITLNDTDVRTLAGKPSGAIALSDLRGKSAATPETISLSASYNISSYGTDVSATAGFRLSETGDVIQILNGDINSTTDIGDWISPKTNISNYEVLATLTGGTLTTGTTGTWQNLSIAPSWSRTRGGGSSGSASCSVTLQIRKVGTTTILATTGVTLSVTTENTGGVVMTL